MAVQVETRTAHLAHRTRDAEATATIHGEEAVELALAEHLDRPATLSDGIERFRKARKAQGAQMVMPLDNLRSQLAVTERTLQRLGDVLMNDSYRKQAGQMIHQRIVIGLIAWADLAQTEKDHFAKIAADVMTWIRDLWESDPFGRVR